MNHWQHELANAITDPKELIEQLNLQTEGLSLDPEVIRAFSCRVPYPYFNRIQKDNPDDPLLKQVLPLNEELAITPGYTFDPLQEASASPNPGCLHKYHGRILIPVTGACAINCRYCFRRHFNYTDHSLSQVRWQGVLDYIHSNPSVHEVIFSGGDPLILKDSKIESLFNDLNQLKQIKTVRFHTRLPIVIPSRITDALLHLFKTAAQSIVMVLHCNHANEIDQDVQRGCQQLKRVGVTLLNQSVLLRGVNDNVQALEALSFKLFGVGVLPYYLHLLDKVQGAAHFDCSIEHAQYLMKELRSIVPGYLVPRLAQEEPGMPAKTVVS